MQKIFFVHKNKAHNPAIKGYKKLFKGEFFEGPLQAENYSQAILWYMMGIYPHKIYSKLVVHDYRSLSVGVAKYFKNRLKKHVNHKPSMRIFQNEAVRDAFSFNDGIPHYIIGVGVHDDMNRFRVNSGENYQYDFCYVGNVSFERNCHEMLTEFVSRYGTSKTFLLVGQYSKSIPQRFKSHTNIVFVGHVSQKQAFSYLAQSEYAVCNFPGHHPHRDQTPTKLLEYAALEKKIICNPSLSNIDTIDRYKINAYVSEKGWFPESAQLETIPDNEGFDYSSFTWRAQINSSGILPALHDAGITLRDSCSRIDS